MVAGAPGSGKSVFAINMALALDTPVLYLAQDSPGSVMARVAALALGTPIQYVIDELRDPEDKALLLEQLGDAYPELFIQSGAVTIEGIENRLEALTEVCGLAPPLVVIDNLMDTLVPGSHSEEMAFFATVLPQLKQMAIRHDVCMMALHHVTRSGGSYGQDKHGLGTMRLRMTDMRYSGEQVAEHVLGIYHNQQKDEMAVQILKQRDGDADPDGGMYVRLGWHPRFGKLDRL